MQFKLIILQYVKSGTIIILNIDVTSSIIYHGIICVHDTAWKVSKYAVFSGPHFPAFALNTERYSVSLRIQSECGKIRTRKNSVFRHFSHSVIASEFLKQSWKSLKNITNNKGSKTDPWGTPVSNGYFEHFFPVLCQSFFSPLAVTL